MYSMLVCLISKLLAFNAIMIFLVLRVQMHVGNNNITELNKTVMTGVRRSVNMIKNKNDARIKETGRELEKKIIPIQSTRRVRNQNML